MKAFTRRWWFLTPDGFAHFRRDPVAQAYEVAIRHPGMPLMRAAPPGPIQSPGLGGRWSGVAWVHGRAKRNPPWCDLRPRLRESFRIHFRRDMQRMGLLRVAFLGPKAVTFNCTFAPETIVDAIRFELEDSALLPSGGDLRERYLRLPLVMSSTRGDMVTIEWGGLFEKVRSSDPGRDKIGNLLGALRTFLEFNPQYRQYRAARIAGSSGGRAVRPKQPSCEVLVLGLLAWDWRRLGRSLKSLLCAVRPHFEQLGFRKNPNWPNSLNGIERLLERVRLSG